MQFVKPNQQTNVMLVQKSDFLELFDVENLNKPIWQIASTHFDRCHSDSSRFYLAKFSSLRIHSLHNGELIRAINLETFLLGNIVADGFYRYSGESVQFVSFFSGAKKKMGQSVDKKKGQSGDKKMGNKNL